MSKYGVQISQQGIDISRAADYQKVLDSNWKFLDIYDEVDIDFTFNITSLPLGFYKFPLYTHSLGYVAGFEFFPSTKSMYSDSFGTYKWNNILSDIKGDSHAVYLQVPPAYEVGRLVGKLRIFTINILEEYTAPTIYTFTTSVQPPGKYGAKFIDKLQGVGNIDSEDMEPFTLNTRGKQISIHKHGVVSGALTGTLEVKHNIGYPPSYMICAIDSPENWQSSFKRPEYSSYYQVGPLVSSFYLARPIDKDTLKFVGVQSSLDGLYGYVIVKDPMEIAG